jgi:hypothetical protein
MDYEANAREYVLHALRRDRSVIFARAEGSRLWDIHGRFISTPCLVHQTEGAPGFPVAQLLEEGKKAWRLCVGSLSCLNRLLYGGGNAPE